MTAELWPQVEAGNPPAVSAAVRVSERRSKLAGLDEPSITRTQISGSLSVEAGLRVEVHDSQRWLTFEELKELGEQSEKLFAAARALVQARSSQLSLPVPSSDRTLNHGGATEPTTRPL